WNRVGPHPGEGVRSTGRPGRAGEGQDGGGESELHWRPVVAVGQRLDGGHVLDASAHHWSDGEPAGQGRREAYPGAGRPVVDLRKPGRGDAVHELEAAG